MIIPLTVHPPVHLLVRLTFWIGAVSGPNGALLGLCDFFRGLLRDFLHGWMSHFHQAPDE